MLKQQQLQVHNQVARGGDTEDAFLFSRIQLQSTFYSMTQISFDSGERERDPKKKMLELTQTHTQTNKTEEVEMPLRLRPA